jgi:SAM-dependent methyltransferase
VKTAGEGLSSAERRAVEACTFKTVPFKFRGRDFSFALSQGLFSSGGIDGGTRLLLKVLSQIWDEDLRTGKPPPRSVLDAGCGAGIMAVCAAGSLEMIPPGLFHVRAQDRDELARLFTVYNREKNGLQPERLSVHTEPLLSGPPGARWDLIFSNVPAKTGKPVLEDFARRLGWLLNPGGRALLVVVNTLAGLFSAAMKGTIREEGGEHTVILCDPPDRNAEPFPDAPGHGDGGLLPAYLRGSFDCEFAGIRLHMDTVYGAPDFDSPGGAIQAAAKLARRLGPGTLFSPGGKALIHEGGQGWFSAWLGSFLGAPPEALVLSGRNILALEAASRNTGGAAFIPAAELFPDKTAGGIYRLIAAFPESIPRTGRLGALWEGLSSLLEPGGAAIVSLPSGEAEDFDRKKAPGFTRLGGLKRGGFRALAYRLGVSRPRESQEIS